MANRHQRPWLIWLGVAFAVSTFLGLGVHASCLLLECGPTREWVPLLTPFVTISALILGYYVWIDQTKLKRQFEVAEKVMLAFIAADDVLNYARNDMFSTAEVKDRPKPEHENEAEARIKDRWYVVLKRMGEGRDDLNGLRQSELLAALYIGREAKDAMAEMWSIVIAVRTSAQMLISTASDAVFIKGLPEENRASFSANLRQWEADCSRHLSLPDDKGQRIPDANRINQRISAARMKIQAACAPYVHTAEIWPKSG